ncbi:MAG: HNH endonuclease [Gammaproteobacteria bacterium]
MRKTYKGKKAPAGYHFMPNGKLMKDSAHKKAGGSVKRNYKGEYKNYQSSTEQKKRRASRNTARNRMIADGKVKRGDGKDVAHKNGNPTDNRKSNLKVVSAAKNRSFRRTSTSRKVNKKS